jgi:hypothetical protein
MTQINYRAEPTAAQFHASPKIVRGFLGPVGNGKSVACIMEMLRIAHDQWPNNKGVRKTRWAIIRNTNPELRTTTLNTWKQWIPESISPVVMHPIISTKLIQSIKNDNTSIEMEVYFVALDKPDDVKKLLSMELTGIFANEARELPYAIVKAARERIGRYPSAIDGYEDTGDYVAPRWEEKDLDMSRPEDAELLGQYRPCKRKVLIMDTNPPDTDHWWYQLAEDGCLKKAENKPLARKETARVFDFFRGVAPLIKQDDGTYAINPEAENIKNLDGGYKYYLDMIAGNTEDHINVQVLGNYGVIASGKPVYPRYNDRLHCAKEHFMPIPGIPICLGWDFGLTPACIIGQMTDTAQVRIIAELTTDDMHVREFARDVVKPYLQKHFSKFEIGFSLGDPAGNNRGEGEGKASIGILNDVYVENDNGDIIQPLDMGFTTEAAPTNDPTKRQDAVNSFLIRLSGGEPGFILDKRCTVIRKGFQGGYCYKRVQAGGVEDRYREVPDKDKHSHPHDALQYLCLGFVGGYVQEVGYENDPHYEDEKRAVGYW